MTMDGSIILTAQTDLCPLRVLPRQAPKRAPSISRSVRVLQLFSLEVRKHENRSKIFWLCLYFLRKARLGNRLNGLHQIQIKCWHTPRPDLPIHIASCSAPVWPEHCMSSPRSSWLPRGRCCGKGPKCSSSAGPQL